MKKTRIAAALCAAFLLTGAFSTVAYAGGGEDIPPEPGPAIVAATPAQDATETEYPASTPAPNPFTPSGTGTVIDTATDADGKMFYTIMTPDENVFYLIIDRQRSTENVYFLNAVTVADLMALAEIPETPSGGAVTEPPAPVTPAPEQPTTPAPEPEKGGGNIGMFAVIAVILLLGGGAGWYFKIYRPKQQGAASMEEMDYSPEDESVPEDWDAADPWNDEDEADDNPPWETDGGRLPDESEGDE